MDGLSRAVPAGVVSVTSVGASVDTRVSDSLDSFILQTLFDFEQLLSSDVLMAVAGGADRVVPGRVLCTQEVAVNIFLDHLYHNLGALMVGICVLLPPVEASLVLLVVQLAVMNRAYFLLRLQVVLLRQRVGIQDRGPIIGTGHTRVVEVRFFFL